MTKDECIIALADAGLIKFGAFTLKSGAKSPVYIDLRECVARPPLFKGILDLFEGLLSGLSFDYICGIPYAALPFASALADRLGKPLAYNRKEEKTYGTAGHIVGAPPTGTGATCLLLDDLVTTGGSKLETARLFRAAGFHVTDIAVLIDRSPDAADVLAAEGYRLRALFTMEDILRTLLSSGKIHAAQAAEVRRFTEGLRQGTAGVANLAAERLREVVKKKQSPIMLSLDVTTAARFFEILEAVAPYLAALKTHVDIIEDFTPAVIDRLRALQDQHGFLIMEDRKFADIGSTVRHQYRSGVHRIADWADLVTVHLIAGETILRGLFEGQEQGGAVLLARMSSEGCLIDEAYTNAVLSAGARHAKWVAGYVAHGSTASDLAALRDRMAAGQLLFVPGVHHERGGDGLGQRYLSVEEAADGGADILIMGRSIYEAERPADRVKDFAGRAWHHHYSRRNS